LIIHIRRASLQHRNKTTHLKPTISPSSENSFPKCGGTEPISLQTLSLLSSNSNYSPTKSANKSPKKSHPKATTQSPPSPPHPQTVFLLPIKVLLIVVEEEFLDVKKWVEALEDVFEPIPQQHNNDNNDEEEWKSTTRSIATTSKHENRSIATTSQNFSDSNIPFPIQIVIV
jgi:hypothetical protein